MTEEQVLCECCAVPMTRIEALGSFGSYLEQFIERARDMCEALRDEYSGDAAQQLLVVLGIADRLEQAAALTAELWLMPEE